MKKKTQLPTAMMKYIRGSILTNLSALVYDVIFADVTLTICAFE
jgi:hypothetical protein